MAGQTGAMRIDIDLVRRIEHSAAVFGAQLAEAMATIAPESRATARSFDGGSLVAFGPGRYVNRAIGVGLGGTAADEVVAAINSFYGERGMAPSLELSPWTDPAIVRQLGADGYRVDWFRNVFVADLPVTTTEPIEPHVIEQVTAATVQVRQAILAGDAAVGTDARRTSDEMCETARILPGALDFLARVDGETAATGSLNVADGIAWIGGAATLDTHRGQGLQTALIAHRVRLAHELGCDLAAATALPNGQSAQNLLRLGFQLVYTQAVLTKPL
jgi:GNAT superfamily N-acetyltransferase